MMNIRCLVIDDEKPARDRLKRMLKEHQDIEILGEASDGKEAIQAIETHKPDLCFLDVQMPEHTGFEVLSKLKHVPHIIFVTAFDQYAVKAFEVESLDYLLKPFSKARLATALDRVRERWAQPQSSAISTETVERLLQSIEQAQSPIPERITSRKGSKIVLLDPKEILWFEADETLIFAQTPHGRCLVEHTLSELETMMGDRFFRAHRQVLIQVAWIHEILPGDAGTYQIRMRGVKEPLLPLSRRQARKLREIFPW